MLVGVGVAAGPVLGFAGLRTGASMTTTVVGTLGAPGVGAVVGALIRRDVLDRL